MKVKLEQTPILPLSKMALRFYEEAEEATGDERHASLIASAALMAAIDRLREGRRREAKRTTSPSPSMKSAR